MKYTVKFTTAYKKSYKKCLKQKKNIALLDEIIELLANGKELPPKNRDHALTGNFAHCRECHIQPDWLLVYMIKNEQLILTLVDTGSHSELFH